MESEILNTIPHRPPFLFIDRILEISENGARAERLIRQEEPQFEGHYPNNPIMPGVLLCESVFQTAAVFLVKTRVPKDELEMKTPVLARIMDAKFKNMIKPGDLIEIEVSYKEKMGQFHFMTGKVFKDGKIACVLEYALALV